jgi:hypothetical protein
MKIFRNGPMVAFVAALALAGCGPQGEVARVASPADTPAESGPATPSKKARTRVSAEVPKTGTSAVP